MNPITVATLNIHQQDGRWRQRRHLLVSQLLSANPDLLSLQEINIATRQGNWLAKELNARLAVQGERPYQLIQKRRGHFLRGDRVGLAVLSRLPIIYHEVVPLGYGRQIGLRVNVQLPNGQPLDFVAIRLHNVPHHDEIRLEQVMKLTGWINRYRRIPLQVIAGDFNEVPQGAAVRYMQQGYQSAYARYHHHDPLATYPTPISDQFAAQGRCLDYIFISPAIKQVTHSALFADQSAVNDPDLYPSDHVGIIATLRLA